MIIFKYLLGLFSVFCMNNHSMAQFSEIEKDLDIGFNGGFEISKNSKPVNWLLYTEKTTTSGDFDIILDTKNYKSGQQSLLFNVRGCSNKGGRFSPGMTQEIEVTPGVTYQLSYWIKNVNAEFTIKVSGVSAFKKDVGPIITDNQDYNKWTKFEHEYTVPENMNRLRFEMNILKPGHLWIDEIKVLEKDKEFSP